MKKFFFVLICIFFIGATSSLALERIGLIVGFDSPLPGSPGHGKGPIIIPSVWLDSYQVEFQSAHPEYVLSLSDSNGFVVFQTVVPSSINTVQLPSTLSGDYELRLDLGESYYFYGDITL